MSVCVAVADILEGRAALGAAAQEAAQLKVPLVAVNLTGSDYDTSARAIPYTKWKLTTAPMESRIDDWCSSEQRSTSPS